MLAYDVEDRFFASRSVLLSPERVELASEFLCWGFGVETPRIEVSDRYDSMRGMYYPARAGRPARIKVGNVCHDWVVAHELGHHLDALIFGGGGHDRAWAACYVYAVDSLLNPQAAKGLNRAFAASGIRRRPGVSLTPQAQGLAMRLRQGLVEGSHH